MKQGQGSGQKNLSYFCEQSSVDIIPIGFIDYFPQQTSGSLPGENFGNACWGDPTYPGSDGQLPERCLWLQNDIPYCQKTLSKKIVLSLGGGTLNYQLTGKQAGIDFANQLWQMYGPYNATYVAQGGIRPLDRGYYNTDTGPYYQIDVDGFDFDIEFNSTGTTNFSKCSKMMLTKYLDASVGYINMISTLRALFLTNPCKEYIITGAPQCTVPDAIMDTMIQTVQFDALWIQYYNTDACSARTWVKGNTALNNTGKSTTAGFTYDNWVARTATGASKNAKLYIGLPGTPGDAAYGHSNDFLWPTEAKNLIKTYVKDTRFGGVMIWEATGADSQYVETGSGLLNYYDFIKSVLKPYAPITTAPVVTLCPSTTSSSSSASKTSTTS
jgi:chitinase